jgi:CRP/FNR family transcriptional regulator
MLPDVESFLQSHTSFTNKVAVPEGMVVCREGQACSDLIVVISGVVRVYKPAEDGRSISLYHVSAGEACILTAGCILNQKLFPAIAETKTDVEGVAIPATLVKQWMDENEVWRNYIFSILNQRFADVIDLANSLAFEQLESRMITWILRNCSQNDLQEQTEIIATHQEIAEELGTSREVVSRKLKSLENKQLISLSRGKLKVVDRQQLENLRISHG